MQERFVLGVMIGLISYSFLYLGKGIQKYAVDGITATKSLKTKHSGIWIFGTVLTALPVFLQWTALLFAPIKMIAPLEGFGLIVLLVFSRFFLKEKITALEITGTAAVIAGIILIAVFFEENPVSRPVFNPVPIYFLLFPLLALECIILVLCIRAGWPAAGYVIGFSAGTAMALQTLSKRISSIPGFALYGSIGVFVFAPLTLFITQLGFTRARAVEVVPAFTSASIIVATLSGFFILSERLLPPQIIGIILVSAGAVCMTAFRNRTGRTPASKGGKPLRSRS